MIEEHLEGAAVFFPRVFLFFWAGEIETPDNLSPSSLKELNKHRPLPVVPLNFLAGRQETRAGATGSKMLAAQCELGVKVRSGAGPITFFPGRPRVAGCQLAGLRSAGEEEGGSGQ